MITPRQQEDTEITLTTGKVLGLFFGLSAVCAVFFALGFLFGRTPVKQAAELSAPSQPAVSTHSGAPKPSAGPPSTNTVPIAAATSTDSAAPTPAAAKEAASPTADNAATTPAADAPQPSGTGYYVQVAAVSKQEDADALIDALKKKQYPAFLPEPVADKLFHVQIGPFASIQDAESVRARLLNDGYSPIIKR